MKKNILLLFLLVSGFCFGQKKYSKPQVDTIKVRPDSVDYAIKHGSLAFLEDCDWKIDLNVNGQSVDGKIGLYTLASMAQRNGKRGIYIYNIKMKKPDGTFKILPSKQIIIEY